VSSTSLDSRELIASPQEILARLERYAAARRAVLAVPVTDAFLPNDTVRRRIDPASVDLFPCDLAASVLACAVTVMVCVSLGRPAALALAAGMIVTGACARRLRWFPSVGVNLVVGAIAGMILVLTA